MKALVVEEFKTFIEFENMLDKEFLKDSAKLKTMTESRYS